MKTRVVTTNPAGHVITLHDGNLTPEQVKNIWIEFYDSIEIIHDKLSIPEGYYLQCYKNGRDVELYQIKWD